MLLAAGKSADSFVALMMLFYFVNCEGQYLKQMQVIFQPDSNDTESKTSVLEFIIICLVYFRNNFSTNFHCVV